MSVILGGRSRQGAPARDDALPLYVQTQGAIVGKSGDELAVKSKGEVIAKARLLDVSSVSVFGNVQVTAQAMRELLARGIPLCHFSYGGWLNGITAGMTHKNVELRIRQFQVAGDGERSLRIARDITIAKIRNSRVMLRRNHPAAPAAALGELERLAANAARAEGMLTLLGIEGAAARVYFSNFGAMVKTDNAAFDFHTRNRRPPKDPVNAALSFLYSMLARQTAVSALAVGFDPYLGFYHQPKYGRPALALDLAEEFRPIVADSAALMLFNNGELKERDFIQRSGASALTPDGRRTVIRAFERRLDTLIRHPLFKLFGELPPDNGNPRAAAGAASAGRTAGLPGLYHEVNCDAQPAYRSLRCQRPGVPAAGAPQDERVWRRLAVFRFCLRPVGQGAGSAGGGADGADQSERGPGADN